MLVKMGNFIYIALGFGLGVLFKIIVDKLNLKSEQREMMRKRKR